MGRLSWTIPSAGSLTPNRLYSVNGHFQFRISGLSMPSVSAYRMLSKLLRGKGLLFRGEQPFTTLCGCHKSAISDFKGAIPRCC